uniref:uncharacterized protein LOC124063694 isoform X5 n=1 Tax=Scatophagus argus TaxID=75038 RepID=UPI001ED7F624|nr:uncharacterized protein LOC124063694 isoform X5 [Scatophagus argus]
MDRSDTDELNIQMPPVAEDNSRINRNITPPACGTSGLASVLSIFCFGLVSGAPGGLLLGGTAVVVLQSLELLSDNRVLMDQLEKYITAEYYLERKLKEFLQWETNNAVNFHISIFAEMFGLLSSLLSLAAGIYIGFSTYSVVIKQKDEAAMGKALSMAGSVSLVSVTATGYILGLTLEGFLFITMNGSILLSFFIPVVVVCLFTIIIEVSFNLHSHKSYSLWLFTPTVVFYLFIMGLISKMRLILLVILTPMILALKELEKSHSIKLTTLTVPLMLIICDLYEVAGQQIVTLQPPTSTDTSSVVPEAIFVGLLTSLLWTVTVGMSLFESWQRGGAGKICATAAGSGAAVLGVIKLALPVLGPGPTVGALVGVAGAAGVSVSAAVAVTEQHGREVDHYGLVGSVGVTMGAAVGAFLSSCVHSGLSGMFMALCAATVPAGMFLYSIFWRLFVCLWMCTYIAALFLSFTHIVWLDKAVDMFFLSNVYLCVYLWYLSEE